MMIAMFPLIAKVDTLKRTMRTLKYDTHTIVNVPLVKPPTNFKSTVVVGCQSMVVVVVMVSLVTIAFMK